jgi:enoyl-CoA hydratase
MSASDDILFRQESGIGLVTLNRPEALNAVTLEMLRALDDKLVGWADDPEIGAVVIDAAGDRAFCAGGDVRRLYDAGQAGDDYTALFFWDEYITDWRVYHFPKPYIALMGGVTMGGGVGISVLGSHRVASEGTRFAMPETGIGFFPDVGGSYFLPPLPGQIGMYLALTGARLGPADCLYAGIATHYVPAERQVDLIMALREVGLTGRRDESARVGEITQRFHGDPGPPPILKQEARIARIFAAGSVEAIIAGLEADGSDWAAATLKTLAGKSPTALKVAHEQLRRGAHLDLDDCLTQEFRISQAFMRNHDFYEGVRAVIIDKDQVPRWQPGRLEDVTDAAVAAYFAPLGARDLTFDHPRRRDQ